MQSQSSQSPGRIFLQRGHGHFRHTVAKVNQQFVISTFFTITTFFFAVDFIQVCLNLAQLDQGVFAVIKFPFQTVFIIISLPQQTESGLAAPGHANHRVAFQIPLRTRPPVFPAFFPQQTDHMAFQLAVHQASFTLGAQGHLHKSHRIFTGFGAQTIRIIKNKSGEKILGTRQQFVGGGWSVIIVTIIKPHRHKPLGRIKRFHNTGNQPGKIHHIKTNLQLQVVINLGNGFVQGRIRRQQQGQQIVQAVKIGIGFFEETDNGLAQPLAPGQLNRRFQTGGKGFRGLRFFFNNPDQHFNQSVRPVRRSLPPHLTSNRNQLAPSVLARLKRLNPKTFQLIKFLGISQLTQLNQGRSPTLNVCHVHPQKKIDPLWHKEDQ